MRDPAFFFHIAALQTQKSAQSFTVISLLPTQAVSFPFIYRQHEGRLKTGHCLQAFRWTKSFKVPSLVLTVLLYLHILFFSFSVHVSEEISFSVFR
jgi:hypothetical protein